MFLSILFFVNTIYSQDIITLKNGDEIKSKVLEVTPDLVKYKNWTNQDGPTYSLTKAEIFMIKYQNGTKDVFKEISVSNSAQNNNVNNGSKFIGTWYHKRYDGNNNKTTLIISKSGVDFLVDYKQMSRGGGFDNFFNTDGSFKETGRLDGNSIVINSFIKLSLMNDNTILMNSVEFVKPPVNNLSSSINSSFKTNTSINSLQNESSNNDYPQSLKTSHIGHFNKGNDFSEYTTNFIQKDATSLTKNLFHQGSHISYLKAKFGRNDNYKNDELTIKQGDTLLFNMTCAKYDFSKKDWDGKKVDYLLSIQIEDNSGKEYLVETYDQPLNIRVYDESTSMYKYCIDIPIKIDPIKMLSIPAKQDLYFNFLVKAKTEKKSVFEGFLKFHIE